MLTATYPSYKNLDRFLIVERLRSLDDYICSRLQRRPKAAKDFAFYTGPFLLDGRDSHLPGSRLVSLTQSSGNQSYYELNDTRLWQSSAEAEEFSS